MAAAGHRL